MVEVRGRLVASHFAGRGTRLLVPLLCLPAENFVDERPPDQLSLPSRDRGVEKERAPDAGRRPRRTRRRGITSRLGILVSLRRCPTAGPQLTRLSLTAEMPARGDTA